MKNLLILVSAVLILSGNNSAQENPNEKFWTSLQSHCGKAFAGEIIHAPENDSFRGKKLVMHIRKCTAEEIKIPFFVGEDKSRTWVLAKIKDRIELKHDHRHEDGNPDDVTMYGGTASNSGSVERQVFPADEETQKMLPAAASNVWWIDLTNESFIYNLRRVGTDRFFSIRFDLTKEMATPEAPWGWDKIVPRRITYNDSQDRYPSFSPDGKKILFESNRSGYWRIYQMNRDGSDPKAISDFGTDSRYPSYYAISDMVLFSKKVGDEFRLAAYSFSKNKMAMSEIDGSNAGIFPWTSPTGRTISYTLNGDMFILDGPDKKPKGFASTKFREAWLRWSPNGKMIAFFSRRDTNDEDDEIYVMDYPDGRPKRITNRKGHDFCPSWSPDGKRLAVAAVDEKQGRSINIIDLEGKILARHGLGFERVTEPNWSPDGKQIVYAARKAGNYDIYTERID